MRFRTPAILLLMLLVAPPRPTAVPHGLPEDPQDAQERWFLQQRAYAGTDISANAQHDGFEAIRKSWLARSDSASPSYVWRSLGPAPIISGSVANTGRITAIAISPVDSNLVIAGSSSGGIWRTTDGGSTFLPVSDDQIRLPVGAVAFAPSNPNVVYAGTGDDHVGIGVLKSTDAGASWRLVTTQEFVPSKISKILVDPKNENIVWLVQPRVLSDTGTLIPNGLLLKSIDGGVTWQSTFSGIVLDALFSDDNGSALLMTAVRGERFGTGGIYRTNDGGASWARVYSGPDNQDSPPLYYLARSAQGKLYASAIESVDDNSYGALLASTDAGAHWAKVSDLPVADNRMLYLGASPHNDQMLFLGATTSYRTRDAGHSWTQNPIHPDQHAIAFDTNDPSRVWLGCDGGLFSSVDGGATFQSLADKLPIVQFYSVNAHPTDPQILFGGSQDNGLQRRDADRLSWTEVLGGDAGAALFDHGNPSRVLTVLFPLNLVRCDNNCIGARVNAGTASTFGESTGRPRSAFITPLVEGPDGTVWLGTWRIFASRDFGTTWTAPAGMTDLTTGLPFSNLGSSLDVISTIGVAASDATVVYTGSALGRVMVTHDAGVTWTDISLPVQRYVTSIAVSHTSAGTAYVSVSGYRSAHIFKTTTFGAQWTESNQGLPDLPADVVYIDKQQPNIVYAGTDAGVFRSDDGGNSWSLFSNGMPPVIVTSFTTTADGRLIAGTYGRGAYVLMPQESPRRRAVRH